MSRKFQLLESEGVGSDQPYYESWRTIEKLRGDRIETWENAQLGVDPPVPQTPFEELLQDHHRLLWAEWNLCDEIEKEWGAVSPLYDSRESRNPGANSVANLFNVPRSRQKPTKQ